MIWVIFVEKCHSLSFFLSAPLQHKVCFFCLFLKFQIQLELSLLVWKSECDLHHFRGVMLGRSKSLNSTFNYQPLRPTDFVPLEFRRTHTYTLLQTQHMLLFCLCFFFYWDFAWVKWIIIINKRDGYTDRQIWQT